MCYIYCVGTSCNSIKQTYHALCSPIGGTDCQCSIPSAEADNEVNMVQSIIDVSEEAGQLMVCAEIVDVTEIERGFNGQFEVEDGILAGKPH